MKCAIEIILLGLALVAGIGGRLAGRRAARLSMEEGYTVRGAGYRSASFGWIAAAVLAFAAFTIAAVAWGGACWPER